MHITTGGWGGVTPNVTFQLQSGIWETVTIYLTVRTKCFICEDKCDTKCVYAIPLLKSWGKFCSEIKESKTHAVSISHEN